MENKVNYLNDKKKHICVSVQRKINNDKMYSDYQLYGEIIKKLIQ